eukprot:gene8357-11325_t
MVSQLVAADHSDRVLSLTSIMSNTRDRAMPPLSTRAIAVLNNRGPEPLVDLEGYLDHGMKGALVVGSPGYPAKPEDIRARLLADFKYCYYPIGFARQYAASAASPDRGPSLRPSPLRRW